MRWRHTEWTTQLSSSHGKLQNLLLEFVAATCRGFLWQEFAATICSSYLPWICFEYLSKPFFYVSKSFFFVNKSFLNEYKPYLYESESFTIYENFFFNIVSFYYCCGSYWPMQVLHFSLNKNKWNTFHPGIADLHKRKISFILLFLFDPFIAFITEFPFFTWK